MRRVRPLDDILNEQIRDAEKRKIQRAMNAKPLSVSYKIPIRNPAPPKTVESLSGVAALQEPKVYTGSKMMGVATMHKSNAVPVFSETEAQDISRMRR